MDSLLLTVTGLLLILLALYTWLNLTLYLKRSRYKLIPRPPLPPGLTWFLGHAGTLASRITPEVSFTTVMAEVSREVDSEVFVLFFANLNFLVLLDQHRPAKVLMNHKVFQKQGGKRDNMAFINGNRVFGERGMVTEIGSDVWRHKRRVMDGAFHKSSLRGLLGQMSDIADKLELYLTEKVAGERFDVYEVLTRVALETICRCGFNLHDDLIFSEDNLIAGALHHIFYAAQLQFQCPVQFKLPWGFRKEKKELKKQLQVLRNMLARRLNDKIELQREGRDEERDMLYYIIKGNYYQDTLHTEDVLDDFFVFVIAGMETTAIVMSLFIFYMMKNPEILEKVRNEVDEVFQKRGRLTFEDTGRLVYLEQCLKETLRIQPPAQATLRVNWNEDYTIDDLFIPQETHIIISQEITQRNPDIWPEPMTFNPDRFDPATRQIAPFTYMPFMAGPRTCIGKHFAMLEMKVMLSKMVREFNFVDPNPEVKEPKMKTVVTSKPAEPILLGLTKRVIE